MKVQSCEEMNFENAKIISIYYCIFLFLILLQFNERISSISEGVIKYAAVHAIVSEW